MPSGVNKFAHLLRPGLLLAAEENPWGFNPLELTILYELCGCGKTAEEVIIKYFDCEPTQEAKSAVFYVGQTSRSKIPQVEPPDYSHPRTIKIWRQVATGVNKTRRTNPIVDPEPEVWSVLMTLVPLIEAESWLYRYTSRQFDLDLVDLLWIDGSPQDQTLSWEWVEGQPFGIFELLHNQLDWIEEQIRPLIVEAESLRKQAQKQPSRKVKSPTKTDQGTLKTTVASRSNFVYPRVCPRCRGGMIPERDWYGEYAQCLSCGYVYESPATPALEDPAEPEGRVKKTNPSRHGKMKLD